MRWFTCTPKNFLGSQIFFDRDSGLMSRGLKSVGLEGRPISLGPAKDGDWPKLIRATRTELENPAWWRQHQLDGLVFYSWGNPEYQKIADAIIGAGIRLVQVSDTHAVHSPVNDWWAHLAAAWYHHWYEGTTKKILRTLTKIPFSHTIGIIRNDLPRARMMDTGEFFLAATPMAAQRYRRMARILRGEKAAAKIRMIPLPVNFHFRFDPATAIEDEVVAVGRWDHPQKRAGLLMETIRLAAMERPHTRFRIFGGMTADLERWYDQLPSAAKDRVFLMGKVSNLDLALAYGRARIMLVSAAYEGCHNASAEALCCGCSIVGTNNPFLGAIEWHTSKNSGRLADRNTPQALATALVNELHAWDSGHRQPEIFSQQWSEIFHPDQVARQILALYGLAVP